jgi:hypothetical protein
MKCYEHAIEVAVGVCLSCGRGLCRDCAALVGRRLTCHGQCEERVKLLVKSNDMAMKALPQTVAQNAQAMVWARRMSVTASMSVFLLGACLIALGHLDWERKWHIAIVGYVFMGFAVMILLASRWLPKKLAASADPKSVSDP